MFETELSQIEDLFDGSYKVKIIIEGERPNEVKIKEAMEVGRRFKFSYPLFVEEVDISKKYNDCFQRSHATIVFQSGVKKRTDV